MHHTSISVTCCIVQKLKRLAPDICQDILPNILCRPLLAQGLEQVRSQITAGRVYAPILCPQDLHPHHECASDSLKHGLKGDRLLHWAAMAA